MQILYYTLQYTTIFQDNKCTKKRIFITIKVTTNRFDYGTWPVTTSYQG